MEARANQLQALLMSARWEIDLLSRVAVQQSEVLDIQHQLILNLDQENQKKFERIERLLDLWGWTFRNPILIDLDPEERESDVVTLVEH